MARLIARSALSETRFAMGGIAATERPDLPAWRVTSHDAIDLPGAISVGPHEALIVGADRPADRGGTGLIQDMSSALTFIEIAGEGALEAIGLSIVARAESGGTATRLADLRVVIAWRKSPDLWLRVAVERSSADYFWQWLKRRIEVHSLQG
jgi:hypothetical protein